MKKRILKILLIISIGLPWARIQAAPTTEGRLLNGKNRPLRDIQLIIKETRTKIRTDAKGRFKLKLTKSGIYTFRVILPDEVMEIRAQILPGKPLVLRLLEQTQEGGVHVMGTRAGQKVSRYGLNHRDLKRLPGGFGDSLKAVLTLPGIVAASPLGAEMSLNIPQGLAYQEIAYFGSKGDQTIPARNSPDKKKNSKAGFLSIRGAPSRSNQVYVDGMSIPYPFHLGDNASVLNNDYIRSLDLYSGTFSARYGDALGGVIKIKGPDNITDRYAHINVSLLNGDFFFQTPFLGGRGYAVAAGRQAYQKHTLASVGVDTGEGSPQFSNAKIADYNDGQYKLGFRLNKYNKISATFLWTRDIGDQKGIVPKGANPNAFKFEFNRRFQVQGASHEFDYGGKIKNTLTAQVSRFRELKQTVNRNPFFPLQETLNYNTIYSRQHIRYADDFSWEILKKRLTLRAGGETRHLTHAVSIDNLKIKDPPISSGSYRSPIDLSGIDFFGIKLEDRQFRAVADGERMGERRDSAYLETEIKLGELTLTPGLRNEYYGLSKTVRRDPRITAGYEFKKQRLSLFAGSGLHSAAPGDMGEFSRNGGNPNLKPETAEKYSAGVEKRLGNTWSVKLEGFKHFYRDLVVRDQFIIEPLRLKDNKRKMLESPEEIMNNPLEDRPLYFSNDGSGESKGVEVFIKKEAPQKSGFHGWLSYTYSLTKRNNHQPMLTGQEENERKSNNAGRKAVLYDESGPFTGILYDDQQLELLYDDDTSELYDYDRTHQLNLVVNYKFNARWQLGAQWRYYTNTPHTPIEGTNPGLVEQLQPDFNPQESFSYGIPIYQTLYGAYNSGRFAPVHHLDLRMDYFMNYHWGHVNVYVEVINAYARKNQESENFDSIFPYIQTGNPGKSNPSPVYQANILPQGNEFRPLFNIGVEVRF